MAFFRFIAGLTAIYFTYCGFTAVVPPPPDVASAMTFCVGVIFCVSFVFVTRKYHEKNRVFQPAERYAKDEITLDEYSARTRGILAP